jgi:membrane fusion protein
MRRVWYAASAANRGNVTVETLEPTTDDTPAQVGIRGAVPRVANPLFRQEVLDFQRYNRQWGRVVPLQPRSTRFMVWCIVAASACVIAFLFFAHYARKEVALGYLTPASGTARVFASQPGTISAVYVAQGQHVEQGQQLLAVDTSQVASGGQDVNAAMLEALEQQKATLTTQLDEEAKRNSSERERLDAQQKQLEGEIATYGAQMEAQRGRISLLQQIVAGGATLAAKGLVSQVDQKHREDALLQQQQALVTLTQQLMQTRAKLTEAQFNLAQLPFALAEKVQSLRNELSSVQQRIAEITGRRAYMVRAPIDGLVSLLQASVGQQADPRRVQLEIVPGNSLLEAKLFIPTKAIGFVEPGQDVKLLYDAFPYQRFGTYRGRIISVSRTVLLDSDIIAPIKINEPVYTATVALDRPDITAHGKKIPLQPDMSLRADIILERRTLIDWIVSPLRDIGLER